MGGEDPARPLRYCSQEGGAGREGLPILKTSLTLVTPAKTDFVHVILVSSVIASRVLTPHICSCTGNNTGGMKSEVCV